MKSRNFSDLERNLVSKAELDVDISVPMEPPKLTKKIMNIVDCSCIGLAYLTGTYFIIRGLVTEVVPELHNEIYRLYADIAQYVGTFT